MVRKDLVPFLNSLNELQPRPVVGITTNGVLLDRYLDDLILAGVTYLNISLDSLSPETFYKITRRDHYRETWRAILNALAKKCGIKINMVIQPGLNDHEIENFARLTKSLPISVRFIEPMPFSGTGNQVFKEFPGSKIRAILERSFELQSLEDKTDGVADRYKITGHLGDVGIIFAYSRTFCHTCSRIRISAQGQMRTCLYGGNVLNLRELLRCKSSDDVIAHAIRDAVERRYKNGFEAESAQSESGYQSMSVIGG